MFPECQWPHTGSGLEVSTHRVHRWPEKSTSENAFSLKGRYLRTLAKLLSLREGLLGLAGFWWIGKGGLEDGGERAGTEIKLVKRDSDRRVARVRMTHEVCFLAVIHAREQKKTNQRSHSCFYESTHPLFPFFLLLFCKHRSFIVLFFQPPLKQWLFQEIIPLYPSGHSARMSSQGYSSSAAWSVRGCFATHGPGSVSKA